MAEQETRTYNQTVRERVLYHPEQLILARDNFVEELTKASRGQNSSISFIRHPIPTPSIGEGEKFQAFVIGGTNYKTATFVLEGGNIRNLSKLEGNFGVIENRSDLIALLLESLDSEVQTLGINFAYPMTPLQREGRLDGQLQRATKEHKFEGLIGENVGEAIEIDLTHLSGRTLKANVANDTICLWLAGREGEDANLAAGIVGTGMNFAIEHQGSIINLESANFDKFYPTDTGVMIDSESSSPGTAKAEKEIAGQYLHKHFNLLRKELGIDSPEIKDTEELSALASENGQAAELACAILERSASLIAVQIAGIYAFKKTPHLTFVMEGSLFWKGTDYRQAVEDYLAVLGVPNDAITFREVESSDIIGAAKLVTS